jgi:hypothetical protein
MKQAAIYLILIILIIIFLQDMKYRKIHIVLPIFLFGITLSFIEGYDFSGKVFFILPNFLFLLLTFSVMVFYMSIKEKKFLNPFKNYFGVGDLLFYLAITPLFFLYNYILFFVLSLVFSIIVHLIVRPLLSQKTVPLAGYAAVFLMVVIVSERYFNYKDITLL